jgi:hypothetical protein
MSTIPTPAASPTLTLEARLELANRLYHECYASCFWHYRPDLVITEESIPLVVKGLRCHGGRQGLLAAAKLAPPNSLADACR